MSIHFYGLVTVKGRFERYEGTLDLRSEPAVHLTIDAQSLDTKQKKARPTPALRRLLRRRATPPSRVHLRPRHARRRPPQSARAAARRRKNDPVRARRDPQTRQRRARSASWSLPRPPGAVTITHADHRELGMTWSPLGILRAPSRLIVRGHLIRQTDSNHWQPRQRPRCLHGPAVSSFEPGLIADFAGFSPERAAPATRPERSDLPRGPAACEAIMASQRRENRTPTATEFCPDPNRRHRPPQD